MFSIKLNNISCPFLQSSRLHQQKNEHQEISKKLKALSPLPVVIIYIFIGLYTQKPLISNCELLRCLQGLIYWSVNQKTHCAILFFCLLKCCQISMFYSLR
jgi:hypothetical protein